MGTYRVKTILNDDIKALAIQPAICMEWAREAFMIKDEAQMPAKLSVHPQGEDFITSMPCLLPEYSGRRVFGIKVVSRIEEHIPTLQSTINLYDATSGQLLALIDGNWITAMRTGAVAALACKKLQRKGTNTYSMVGLGNIARAVALCLIDDNRGRDITFRLLRYKDQAEKFVERFNDYGHVSFDIIDDRREFIEGADVVISCVTVATELLFPDDELFRKGVTVVPVHVRGFQNCDLFFDKVFGDDTGQIRRFKYFDRFRQYDEFHHVLQGKNPGRVSADERILAYNYGLGLHDVFFASCIYERLQGEGHEFEMKTEDRKIWV